MSSTAARRIGATGRERTLYAAAALSLLAGLIHLWVTPEHFEEWWGYGDFFLVAGAAQILYVPIVVLLPTRIVLLSLALSIQVLVATGHLPSEVWRISLLRTQVNKEA